MKAANPLNDQECWEAMCQRDTAYDNRFVFAVQTTGIYCRPSCSSRRANRENVSFFPTWKDAEKAGYRACKRCKPDLTTGCTHTKSIQQACITLETAEVTPTLSELAAQVGLSPGHFQRIFKAEVGLSPKQYAIALRKQRLREALTRTETITEAIYQAGYNSSSRAYADQTSAKRTKE